ncbi:MAG: hypothetical protein Q4E13_02465 [Clostridia bacterium]|nr:hypothetical protein [Clostridia bacterium]
MDFVLERMTLQRAFPMIRRWANGLPGVIDDFFEQHVLEAIPYAIRMDGIAVGFFALYPEQAGHRITAFSLEERYWAESQRLFARILDAYSVTRAYVVTHDELFLSLCMDVQVGVEPQAYFFDGRVAGEVAAPRFGRECLSKVLPDELPAMYAATGDFFDDMGAQGAIEGRYQFWKLAQDGEVLGYGVTVPLWLREGTVACGEITLPQHRHKGVARSMQLHLGDWARENGLTPVGGCWFRNEASRNTFYSAGKYSRTRLLNVRFSAPLEQD